jgi:hypothetical protein
MDDCRPTVRLWKQGLLRGAWHIPLEAQRQLAWRRGTLGELEQ